MFSYLLSLVTTNGPGTKYSNVNSSEFRELVSNDKSATLLDVRTEQEYVNGHIASAGQLNFYSLGFRKKLLLLPKDEPVYLYCNTGYRSKIAARFLARKGYSKIYNLENGIMDWELNDLPIITEPGATPDTNDKMEPDEFNALITGDQPVMIDFYAPWCAPCRSMMPVIDRLKKEYRGRVRIVKINVDASKRLVKKLKIGGVPYFALYKKGEIQYKHYGVVDEPALKKILEAHSPSISEK